MEALVIVLLFVGVLGYFVVRPLWIEGHTLAEGYYITHDEVGGRFETITLRNANGTKMGSWYISIYSIEDALWRAFRESHKRKRLAETLSKRIDKVERIAQ